MSPTRSSRIRPRWVDGVGSRITCSPSTVADGGRSSRILHRARGDLESLRLVVHHEFHAADVASTDDPWPRRRSVSAWRIFVSHAGQRHGTFWPGVGGWDFRCGVYCRNELRHLAGFPNPSARVWSRCRSIISHGINGIVRGGLSARVRAIADRDRRDANRTANRES